MSCRAKANAAITPTGPPPAMMIGSIDFMDGRRDEPLLLKFDIRKFYRFGPQLGVRRNHCPEIFGRVAERRCSITVKPPHENGILGGLADIVCDPVKDVAWRARRRHESIPGHHVEDKEAG